VGSGGGGGGCGDQGRSRLQRQPSRWRAEGDVGFNKSSSSDVIIDVRTPENGSLCNFLLSMSLLRLAQLAQPIW
jgi:hypothetical protein